MDPAGKKAGIADDDYIERYIVMWNYLTTSTKTREDAIKALSPYVASEREDTYLHLLSTVLESQPDELVSVDQMMETWKGRYDEMFVMVDNHI